MKSRYLIIVALAMAVANGALSQGKDIREKTLLSVNEDPGKTEVNMPGVKIQVNDFSDTTGVITLGHKRFEIIENHNNVKIRMTHVPREKFKGHFAGFDIGFNNFLTSDYSTSLPDDASFLNLNSGKSLNVGVNFLQYSIPLQRRNTNFGLVTGMGLNLSNYRFDSNNILTKDADTGETTYYEETTRSVRKNKLLTTYINIPLLMELQVPAKGNHRFFINAGGFCGFNIGTHTKVVYNDGGGKDKEKQRGNMNVRPFQYGLTTRLGYRFLKLYANYNLTSLFEDKKGPEIYPFSVGVTLVNL